MTLRGFPGRWAVYGLGIALSLGTVTPVAAADKPARSPGATTIHHKSRSFKIPFNVDPAERSRLSEVQLWVSEDSGYSWKAVSRTTPDHPAFTFRAARDDEYWFAVRTLDTKGRLYPGEDEAVEPSMKVIIDTKPPTLVLEPDGRRGSTAAVRWEAQDEHLDLSTLVLEYQVEGAREWRQVPIRRPSLIGKESWDAGTAEPLKVRATIADKAGNSTEASETLPGGSARDPGSASNDLAEFSAPPPMTPVSPISSNSSFPPAEDLPPAAGGPDPLAPPHTIEEAPESGPDAFNEPNAGRQAPPTADPGDTSAMRGAQTLLVPSPQFALQYAVDDAGPNGPAVVELWATQDGGRTWIRRGEDADRTSPFEVDLGGQGTFGLSLVARSASGLGDQPPAPGDPPRMWVEIDSTPPNVQLDPPQVGTGANAGKIAIQWRAADLHIATKPVSMWWRPDLPGARWRPIVDRVENTGKYIWTLPPEVPAKFHVRVDVLDTLGNLGSAETTETGPVIVDRARPRSRIIGLDPSTRTGTGPAARPLR